VVVAVVGGEAWKVVHGVLLDEGKEKDIGV
jgi:hypothetical protein